MTLNKHASFKDLQEEIANSIVQKWHTQDPQHKNLDLLIEITASKLRELKDFKADLVEP